jgi:ferredoxin
MSGQQKFISGDWRGRMFQALEEDGFQVYMPVKEGELTRFKAGAAAEQMVLECGPTHYPMKEIFFPMSESILNYESRPGKEDEFSVPKIPKQKIAVLGARPCDTSAMGVLDAVFNWDYKDNFYNGRRDQSLIVSVACTESDSRCFCTSVGLGPESTEGSDLLVHEAEGQGAVISSCSEKGAAFMEAHAAIFESVPEAVSTPVAEVAVAVDVDNIKPWLDTHFEDDYWEEISMKCLGCAACSYLCPTCHCFDVVDEADWQHGERRRNYDCCTFGLFTLHTSGHNPRPSGANRWRNRLMHKFKYFPERFDRRACVGCGRCMRVCGAGRDLIEILEHIVSQPVPEAVAEGSVQPAG